MDTNLKIKNDRPDGASIRVQAWDGAVPTYNSDEQKANALGGAKAVDPDAPKKVKEPGEKDVVEKLPAGYDKMKKAELVELLESRQKLGHKVELDEADTVAILREKIEATYPEVIGDEDEKEPEAPPVDTKPKPAVDTKYDFKAGNLLQEITLTSNEEKTITVSSGHFLTIKIDE